MILQNVTFVLFTLLILLSVSKLLCQPQNIIQTPQPAQAGLMNDTIPSQSTTCLGCRKLFSYDLVANEPPEEYFINTGATTLLGDIINANVDIVNGNQELHLAPKSEKPEVSIFSEVSERFTNSMSSSLTETSEDSRSLASSSHTSLDKSQMEVSLNERNRKDLEDTRTLNSVKFGNHTVTYSMIRSLSKKDGEEDESHLVNNLKSYAYAERLETDHEPLSNLLTVEPHHPQENTEEKHTSLSLGFDDTRVNGGENIQPIKIRDRTSEIINEADKTTTLNQNNYEVLGNSYLITETGMDALQNNDNLETKTEITNPTNIIWSTAKNSRYLNFPESERQMIEFSKDLRQVSNKRNNKYERSIFPAIQRDVKSSQENHVTNVNGVVLENLEVSESVDFIRESSRVVTNVNGVVLENLEVSESVDFKREPSRVVTNVNGVVLENLEVSESVDFIRESSPVVTNVNGIVIKEHFENPRSVNLTTELPPTMTNVNSTIKDGTTRRLKSNKTQNLLQGDLAAECEAGSGSCLKCREISPKCHYNFRSKLCFFADVVHGNVIYECGIRFITADGYQPFWIALAVLIICSLIVLFFLARAFYKRILQKDAISDMEVEDVRNIVHLIKDKRGV